MHLANVQGTMLGLGALAGAVGAIGLVVLGVIRPLRRVLQRVGDFFDDWYGQPARPGKPAVPGVLERVQVLEDEVRAVKREVRPNGGGSLRDAVARIETSLAARPPV